MALSEMDLPSPHTAVTIRGDRLKQSRLAAGMTQAELAKAAGYSERLIRKVENSESVRFSTVCNLAEALRERGVKVTAECLVGSTVTSRMEQLLTAFTHGNQSNEAFAMLLHPGIRLRFHGLPIPEFPEKVGGRPAVLRVMKSVQEMTDPASLSITDSATTRLDDATPETAVIRGTVAADQDKQVHFTAWLSFTDERLCEIQIFCAT